MSVLKKLVTCDSSCDWVHVACWLHRTLNSLPFFLVWCMCLNNQLFGSFPLHYNVLVMCCKFLANWLMLCYNALQIRLNFHFLCWKSPFIGTGMHPRSRHGWQKSWEKSKKPMHTWWCLLSTIIVYHQHCPTCWIISQVQLSHTNRAELWPTHWVRRCCFINLAQSLIAVLCVQPHKILKWTIYSELCKQWICTITTMLYYIYIYSYLWGQNTTWRDWWSRETYKDNVNVIQFRE